MFTSGFHLFCTRVQLPLFTEFSHFSNRIPKAQACQVPAFQALNLLSTNPGKFSPVWLKVSTPYSLHPRTHSTKSPPHIPPPCATDGDSVYHIAHFPFKSQWGIRGPKKGSDLPKVTQSDDSLFECRARVRTKGPLLHFLDYSSSEVNTRSLFPLRSPLTSEAGFCEAVGGEGGPLRSKGALRASTGDQPGSGEGRGPRQIA